MAQRTNKVHLTIILIGKAGHGKSATGNSILGRTAFERSAHLHSGTRFVTNASTQHGQYEIKVVDGPGFQATNLDGVKNKKQMFENMTKALRMCKEGTHIFVLVVKFRFSYTEEDRKAISDLKQIFGDNYLKDHGIIVMSGGDYFPGQMEADGTPGKTFNEWFREQDKVLGNLIKECSPRVVLFNNLSISEEETTRQRNELLFHAGQLQKESTPTCRMAQTTDIIPLNILLIGKTGHGKSATGNSILGQKAFKRGSNAGSITKEVAEAWAEHVPYEIKVVDGPGLEDTDLDAVKDKEQACENMAKALMMCNGGIHAFVLVLKFSDRYTNEERKTISDLKQIFGENYLKDHGIIVMTGGDSFPGRMEADDTPGKTFKEWCREQVTDFGNLIEECSPRVVLFNNITKSEEEKTRQRNELLFHAGQLQKQKGFYTTEHFQEYAQVRDKLIKDSKQKILEETIQKRISLLSAEIGRLSIDTSLKDVDKLDARITDVYMEIGEESLQEESMQQLIGSLKRLRTTTEELRTAIQEKNTRAVKSNLAVMSKHQEELNKTRKAPWSYFAACFRAALATVVVVAACVALAPLGVASVAVGEAKSCVSTVKDILKIAKDYIIHGDGEPVAQKAMANY